jgi:hypothetical protein
MSKRPRETTDIDGHVPAANEGHEGPNGLDGTGTHEGHIDIAVDAPSTTNEANGGTHDDGQTNGINENGGDVGMTEAGDAEGGDGVRIQCRRLKVTMV